LLAGRDLVGGGTWFGVKRSGRFAAITNYRNPGFQRFDAPSRGRIVTDFLRGGEAPADYLAKLSKNAHRYNGFSVIVGDLRRLFYFSNRNGTSRELCPGMYGLSNHLLDTAWPKIDKGKKALAKLLSTGKDFAPADLFKILADPSRPPDHELPDTGVGLEWERPLASLFITTSVYGTRSSTVLLADKEGRVLFEERTFDRKPELWKSVRYEFEIEPLV
jgi:uncharacterized protein with NRDE domain